MEQEMDVLAVKDARKFEVHCNAGNAGELFVGTESLSIKIGQRIQRDGVEEMWHSLLIHCNAAEDGSLRVKVIVCHFDWEEARQIALIQSDPACKEASPSSLIIDFEQKDV